MPTARPSITPSIGVTEAICTCPDSDSASMVEKPTPTNAVSTGRAAPTAVRSMISRTTTATTTPTISPAPIADISWAISVE